MDFARRPHPAFKHQPQGCAHSIRVPGRPRQPDTQTGFAQHVLIELGFGSILADRQINAPVVIEIA